MQDHRERACTGPHHLANQQPTTSLPIRDMDPHLQPAQNLAIIRPPALNRGATGHGADPTVQLGRDDLLPQADPESHHLNCHEVPDEVPVTENISASRRLPVALKTNSRQAPLPAKQQTSFHRCCIGFSTDQFSPDLSSRWLQLLQRHPLLHHQVAINHLSFGYTFEFLFLSLHTLSHGEWPILFLPFPSF
jgi:hypothetical protein